MDKKQRIAKTPEPPYYSVTTTALLNEDLKGYIEMAQQLYMDATKIKDFLGLEYCLDAQCGIAVSYWRNKDSIDAWRKSDGHVNAKRIAKQQWFERYITRIAYVDKVY